jgi:dTDP-4-amino-4,6-dideoxygalactose transaminase
MIASAWPVTYLGAKPVFVDCEGDLNISVEKIRDYITPRTKAIIVTHIYGRPAEMKEILAIAYEYNLKIIEDACEAHGATIGEKKVGSFGDIGCFSLFANKIISSGEGGLITTDSEFIYKQLQHLKAMAFDPGHTFLHPKIGYNFRMTNLQAAVALAQLERIDGILEKRQQIQSWYDKHLGEYTIPRPEGSVLWMYDILAGNREELIQSLAEEGIETRRFFKPMTIQPMYRQKMSGYVANHYSEVGLYLPTYTQMTEEDVNFISEKVLKYITKL